jgi:hypothetical protein
MTDPRISETKDKLTQGRSGLSREDVEWLKRELAYGEHQGEVDY